ncbi:hypothetical protein BKA69DRAFT_1127502 [Paraphysoderma sedebokerense]|nr:hypothetical protein BKA69DRAFT_1127502 [Paraphysoderma sedebokerense]
MTEEEQSSSPSPTQSREKGSTFDDALTKAKSIAAKLAVKAPAEDKEGTTTSQETSESSMLGKRPFTADEGNPTLESTNDQRQRVRKRRSRFSSIQSNVSSQSSSIPSDFEDDSGAVKVASYSSGHTVQNPMPQPPVGVPHDPFYYGGRPSHTMSSTPSYNSSYEVRYSYDQFQHSPALNDVAFPQWNKQQPFTNHPNGQPPVIHALMEKRIVFSVPNRYVGMIIGKSGENLKVIESETGARITFDKDTPPDAADRQVAITGSEKSVQRARELMDENVASAIARIAERTAPPVVARPFHSPGLKTGDPLPTEFITVPTHRVGAIIGHRGAMIHELQDKTGCKINISPSGGQYETERPIALTGTREAIAKAKEKIFRIMSQDTRKKKQNVSRAPPPYPYVAFEAEETISISADKADYLIRQVSEIQNMSSCQVLVEPLYGNNTMRNICLRGNAQSIDTAKRIIWDKVNSLNNSNHSPNYGPYSSPPPQPFSTPRSTTDPRQSSFGQPTHHTAFNSSGYGNPPHNHVNMSQTAPPQYGNPGSYNQGINPSTQGRSFNTSAVYNPSGPMDKGTQGYVQPIQNVASTSYKQRGRYFTQMPGNNPDPYPSAKRFSPNVGGQGYSSIESNFSISGQSQGSSFYPQVPPSGQASPYTSMQSQQTPMPNSQQFPQGYSQQIPPGCSQQIPTQQMTIPPPGYSVPNQQTQSYPFQPQMNPVGTLHVAPPQPVTDPNSSSSNNRTPTAQQDSRMQPPNPQSSSSTINPDYSKYYQSYLSWCQQQPPNPQPSSTSQMPVQMPTGSVTRPYQPMQQASTHPSGSGQEANSSSHNVPPNSSQSKDV